MAAAAAGVRPEFRRSIGALPSGAGSVSEPGSTALSSTNSGPTVRWTGRGAGSTPSASGQQNGATDRTTSDRPRQAGIENPPGHRPERTAAVAGHLRRQRANGVPCVSVITWCFEPGPAWSTGFGPVLGRPDELGGARRRPPRATSPVSPPDAVRSAAPDAAGPTPRPRASHATGANRSFLIRS